MFAREPFLSIRQFGFADLLRSMKKRIPGICRVIRNTAPLLYDGEAVRRGYAAYTNVTAPTGLEVLKVCPIQSPSQEDIHIWFATNSGQKVYINPWWQGAVKQTTNLLINETLLAIDPTDVDVTISSTNSITIANAVANGFSATPGYYNGWVLNKNGTSQYAFIKTYVVTAGTGVFTTTEDVGSSGFGWATSAVFNLYRNFHDNLTFAPTYNTDLANAPCAKSENSIVRFSGGQSSATGNRPIQYTPELNRTFFPGISARKFTYTGSYISERELKSVDYGRQPFPLQFSLIHGLEVNRTYWVAIAPVYDGYQIGPLTRYEAAGNYGTASGWTENYLTAGGSSSPAIQIGVQLSGATLNKRITGFAFYAAQDTGDTRTLGRQTPYFFIGHVPTTSTNQLGSLWTYVGSTSQAFEAHFAFDGGVWDARGGVYTTDSGIVEIPTDTMYAYSDEVSFAGKHWLTNTYVTSESFVDRQNLFTNPTGGNAGINAGLNQPDIFSNEQGIYRIMPDPTVGTKLTGMVPLGIEELLVTRDRGLLLGRPDIDPLGFVEFTWDILSQEVGSATLAQLIQADDGYIYFAGYDDIYRYRNAIAEPLVEHGEKNDWLYTYRESITKSQKESTVIWYLPEGIVYFDIAQTNGLGFAFYPPRILGGERTSNYGWRQVNFKQTSGVAATQFFKWMNTLQGGTIIGVTTDSPAVVMQFSDPTTHALYYQDAITSGVGTPIKPYIDTGDIIPSGKMDLDFRWNKLVLDKSIDVATSGQLDITILKDRTVLSTRTSLNKATERLEVHSMADEPRIGQEWRFLWNANASTPEVMQSSGKQFQLNTIDLYGDTLAYMKRASDSSAVGSEGCLPTIGQVGGVNEVLYTTANQDQTFNFDVPFTSADTYVSPTTGLTETKFGWVVIRARAHSGADVGQNDVTLVSKTITGFTINCPQSNVLVEYAIVF